MLRNIIGGILVAALFLPMSITGGQPMQPKVKGLYGLNLNAAPFNTMKPEEVVAWVKDTGANVVFFRPRAEDMPTVVALRKAGIKVCVEISLFVGKNHWEKHPPSRPITAEGKPIEPDKWYYGVCPNQNWLWIEKLKEIKKLGEEFPLDGVWLDFIRYPCHWEVHQPRIEQTCFCLTCRCMFQSYPGMMIPPDVSKAKDVADWVLKNHEKEWAAFKCDRIATFCKLAKETLNDARPGAVLGAFTVPWKESDYDDAIHKVIAQDYVKMAEYVDVFSPMVYHRMCNRPVEWIADFTAYAKEKTKRQLWPIIQACNEPDTLSAEEFEKSIAAGLRAPSDGVLLFSLAHILKENRLEGVRRGFQ